jgi:hypothetical protein
VEVVSNPGTQYRVRVGFTVDYTELHLDVVGLAELDAATLGPDVPVYSYTDVTSDVTEITISRGRDRTTDAHRAGYATVRLLDQARDYDPENTAGPYYGNIVKGRSLLVEFRKTGPTWHTLFAGNIEQIAYEMRPGDYQVAEFVATDPLATLGRQAVQTDTALDAALTGARTIDLLALASTLAYGTSIATGTVSVVAATAEAGSTILDLLQQVATAEGGEFYAAADGTLTFRQRYANANPVSTFEFTPDLGSVRYSSISLETAAEVYPQINVTDSTGAVQTARNGASYADYTGILSPDTGNLLAAADAETLATYLLAQYGEPTTNVRIVQVPVIEQIEAHIHDLLLTDLGDAVQVERTFTVGAPLSLTEWYGVEAIEHRIDRGRHDMTIGLGAKTSAGWMQLDSAAFGTLDSNALA